MRAMATFPDANSQTRNGAAIGPATGQAKSLVMTAIGQMVEDGKAEWSRTATGETELRLLTGEVFLLGEISITRIA